MTFAKFVAQCPAPMKSMSAWHLPHLENFFGSRTIAQITDDDVIAYRDNRAKERIIKHGKKSAKLVSPTTINKEVGRYESFCASDERRDTRTKSVNSKWKGRRVETAPLPTRNIPPCWRIAPHG
jgi:hypothetical protein